MLRSREKCRDLTKDADSFGKEEDLRRNVDINEITDGKSYTANDMVKIGCGGCQGCFSCCQGMGSSVTLDPYDMWQLNSFGKMGFEQLFGTFIELHAEDGLIFPNLKMAGEKETCAFLNDEGRCSIHAFRPGLCRLFPLGRMYTEDGFSYIHQIHECKKADKTKVKIKKWMEISDLTKYEQYVKRWHDFTAVCKDALEELSEDEKRVLALFLLKTFFQRDYPAETEALSFYEEFYKRLYEAEKTLGLLDGSI